MARVTQQLEEIGLQFRETSARLDELRAQEREAWGEWRRETPLRPKQYEAAAREDEKLTRTAFGLTDRLIYLRKRRRELEEME